MRTIVGVLTVIFAAGCTLQYVPEPTPEELIVVPIFTPGQPVAIVNKTPSNDVLLPVPPYDLRVDYRQYADSAIQLLRSELEKRRSVVQATAARKVGLNITDVRIVPGAGRFRAVINCTVTTGDGYVRGLEASQVNWNFKKAIDGAVVNVVKEILTNDRVRRYLSE